MESFLLHKVTDAYPIHSELIISYAWQEPVRNTLIKMAHKVRSARKAKRVPSKAGCIRRCIVPKDGFVRDRALHALCWACMGSTCALLQSYSQP